MADHAEAQYPAYLGRLHMRLAGGAFNARKDNERLSDADLSDLYQDHAQNYIRSKYKGKKLVVSHPDSDPEGGMELDPLVYTSGIPIFGNDDAAVRAGWSRGHSELRSEATRSLKQEASDKGFSRRFSAEHARSENSHALGHGDYGTDHILSAPSASKAQNTEQLAIELGMRHAAELLNWEQGMDDEHSLVHAKITDVLHPQNGRLMARRIRLIRRIDKDDREGTVVFDHLMDGNRLHISREEAFDLGKRVHDALLGEPVEAEKPYGLKGPHRGMGGAVAPTATELRNHQAAVLRNLQAAKPANIAERATSRDRAAVDMIGPAFTEASFPADQVVAHERDVIAGEDALREMRNRMIAHQTPMGAEDDEAYDIDTAFRTSGSVPADADSTLLRGIQAIRAQFKLHVGSRMPTSEQIRDYSPHLINDLMAAHTIAHNSEGNREILRPDERQMLEEVDALRARITEG
ncbi:MAG: hypothetical protein MI743_22580 [Sneathiellales bacterium]|nr:hypothetical protein [Sneathiellales bacterium]